MILLLERLKKSYMFSWPFLCKIKIKISPGKKKHGLNFFQIFPVATPQKLQGGTNLYYRFVILVTVIRRRSEYFKMFDPILHIFFVNLLLELKIKTFWKSKNGGDSTRHFFQKKNTYIYFT